MCLFKAVVQDGAGQTLYNYITLSDLQEVFHATLYRWKLVAALIFPCKAKVH